MDSRLSETQTVDDDAMHMEASHGVTYCRQFTDKDTILGTRQELEADPGGACWSCVSMHNAEELQVTEDEVNDLIDAYKRTEGLR